MLKLIVMAMFLSTSALADTWEGCGDVKQPGECNESPFGNFSANENSCLLKLYTCGRYERIVERIDTLNIGLAPEHNYYLGVAYFGLSNRTDAQSLKCFYTRQAKAQLEEFLIATNADPATNVSYGGDQRIDILYQATRIFGILKKASGCTESSFSEGTIYRMAQLKTQEQIKRVLHDTEGDDQAQTGSNQATQKTFQGMRDNLNSIITKASQLESRYYLYRTQIDVSKEHLRLLAEQMHSEFGDKVKITGSLDLPDVEIVDINKFIPPIRDTLQSSGLSALQNYEDQIKSNLVLKKTYYDSIRQDKIDTVNSLNRSFAIYTNTFKVDTPPARAIHAALSTQEGGSQVPVLLSSPLLGLIGNWQKTSCSGSRIKPWFCVTGGGA